MAVVAMEEVGMETYPSELAEQQNVDATRRAAHTAELIAATVAALEAWSAECKSLTRVLDKMNVALERLEATNE